MAALERTRTPGIYKRGNRYVVTWRHRGKQHKQSFRTYEEAREAKAQRQAGHGRPVSKVRLEDYFSEWIETANSIEAVATQDPVTAANGRAAELANTAY